MRSRILPVVLFLVVLVLLGLGIPLALSIASSEQESMFLDRVTSTERLASLAQQPLVDGQTTVLGQVLQRYAEVYGFTAAVLDEDGNTLGQTPSAPNLVDNAVQSGLGLALAGRQPERGPLFLPWHDQPLVVAEPVMVGGEVRGAVVTVSPVDALRDRVLIEWALVLIGGLTALGLATLFALPVVRWILRPINRLDEAASRVAAAVTAGDELDPTATRTGPPELRRLARSFDEMAAGVTDAFAAQRAFVADASHQLRNPLTALQVRLSNMDESVAPDAAEDYAAAVSETQRLNEVLDSLLALARTEAGSGPPVSIDASAAARERVAAWRAVAAARDVELRADVPDGLTVHAVPRAVDRILDAVLDNAVKFSTGRPDAIIEVSATRVGATVRISVRDHGPGLEPSELDRVTDRFWRAPRQQNVSGSGLGMAIVAQIVNSSHGALTLDLPEGGGLRIAVDLPAQPA